MTVSTSVEFGYDIQNAALYYCVFEKYGSCELSGRLVGMCSADDEQAGHLLHFRLCYDEPALFADFELGIAVAKDSNVICAVLYTLYRIADAGDLGYIFISQT